ncbi:hypothetical protein [Rhodopirellula sallentina]|nr:hypothetical protein [Rhodopirellula sallentina]
MKKYDFRCAALLVFVGLSAPCFGGEVATNDSSGGVVHFRESGGLVVMEAESTHSDLGDWVLKTDVEDYRGKGHIEFTANTKNGGNPKSPLQYRFTIEKPGTYQLSVRSRKRLEGEPGDKCNDGYFRVVGDFQANEKGAGIDILTVDTKLYGGNADSWGWAKMLDAHHKKHLPLYEFKAGETYTLVMSGRSIRWNVDQIVFRHESIDESVLNGKELEESPRVE